MLNQKLKINSIINISKRNKYITSSEEVKKAF